MRIMGPAILLSIVAQAATAQVSGHLDLGLGSTSTPRLGMASMVAIAPELRFTTSSFRLATGGDFRDLGGVGHDLLATAAASYFVRLPAAFQVELSGTGALRDASGLLTESQYDGGIRLHQLSQRSGVWAGLSTGRDRFGVRTGWNAGMWHNFGAITVQLEGKQLSSGTLLDPIGGAAHDSISRVDSTTQSTVRLTTELGTWLSYAANRIEFRTGGGWRIVHGEPATGTLNDNPAVASNPFRSRSDGWWTAEGTYWLSERIGVTGAVGRLAPDPSLLVNPSNYVRLSLRVGIQRRAPHVRTGSDDALRLTPRANSVALDLLARLARRVEIMSDLTDWQPVELTAEPDGRWRIVLPATPGIHYLNVRYDGGAWRTPPTLTTTQDEFGMETGVLFLQ